MKRPILSFIIPVLFVENANNKVYGRLGYLQGFKKKEPIYDDRTLRMYDAGANRC